MFIREVMYNGKKCKPSPCCGVARKSSNAVVIDIGTGSMKAVSQLTGAQLADPIDFPGEFAIATATEDQVRAVFEELQEAVGDKADLTESDKYYTGKWRSEQKEGVLQQVFGNDTLFLLTPREEAENDIRWMVELTMPYYLMRQQVRRLRRR